MADALENPGLNLILVICASSLDVHVHSVNTLTEELAGFRFPVPLCGGRAIGTPNIDGQRTHRSVAECRRRSDETILVGHADTYIRRTLTLNSRERM
jgi:hypothetical protein